MKSIGGVPALVAFGAALALAGCATTVAGSPVATRQLDRVLPGTAEVSTALGIGATGFMGQLVQGGADTLLQGVEQDEATPVECVSAGYRLQKAVYGTTAVQSVASRSWAGGGTDTPVYTAFFGVVELAGTSDAASFFATVAERWLRCDGRTMALRQERGAESLTRITDVAVDGRIISAVLTHDPGGSRAQTVERALGVAADCIVDVEVTDKAASGPGGAGGAVALARLMLAKLG